MKNKIKILLLLIVMLMMTSCLNDAFGPLVVKSVENVSNYKDYRYKVTFLHSQEVNLYTNINYKVGDTIK